MDAIGEVVDAQRGAEARGVERRVVRQRRKLDRTLAAEEEEVVREAAVRLGREDDERRDGRADGADGDGDATAARRGGGSDLGADGGGRQGEGGPEFAIDNPNAPTPVNGIDVQELKRMIDAGESFEFLDVRTPEERAQASIPGARLLDASTAREIEALDRDRPLVFHCHHGGRSRQAAEHFRNLGFRRVYDVLGGIDAWSAHVDPSVPRY